MKVLITLIFAGIAIGGYAQTKKIQHKSHSGDMDQMTIEVNGNIGEFIAPIPKKLTKPAMVDTLTKKAMIYDSVSTYKFLMDSTKILGKPKKRKR